MGKGKLPVTNHMLNREGMGTVSEKQLKGNRPANEQKNTTTKKIESDKKRLHRAKKVDSEHE